VRDVAVIGVGMHPFGQFADKGLKDLGRVAIWNAIKDAGVPPKDIQVAYSGNSLGGLLTGQEGVRGQTIIRDAGFGGIPIINVENACASGSTAFRGAWLEVASGLCDVALAVGVEKMFVGDVAKSMAALAADSDVELARMGLQFAGLYAMGLKKYMDLYGVTKEHFAKVVVKNSYNGSLNPYAQFRKPLTMDRVLNSPVIAEPITLLMCSSISDGAAAAILCSKDIARRYSRKPVVEVAACALRSGMWQSPEKELSERDIVALAAKEAYRQAGVGPEDIDVAEVHDGMAPAEMMVYEEIGLCGEGEAKVLVDQGRTAITGDIPVNPSGGLAAKGHPIGATGIAQIAEIVWQLRGEAGKRQVSNPRIGLCQNTGGYVDGDAAACSITILKV